MKGARDRPICLVMKTAAVNFSRFRALLSAREVERSERFRFQHDQDEYVTAHGLKRLALAALTGQPPRELGFYTEIHGKPGILGSKIPFNLSHSRGHVALLVGTVGQVGVDLELPDPRLEYKSLIAQVAHSSERDRITNAAEFYRLWTSKEAACKATGEGLRRDPTTFALMPHGSGEYSIDLDDQRLHLFAYPSPIRGHIAFAFSSRPTGMLRVDVLPTPCRYQKLNP